MKPVRDRVLGSTIDRTVVSKGLPEETFEQMLEYMLTFIHHLWMAEYMSLGVFFVHICI